MAPNLSKPPAGSIRSFVAIELPVEIRAALAAVEDGLREHASILKLVAPELLHLTVRFLGQLPADRIGAVEEATRTATESYPPFRLRLAMVGSFGGAAPRVVWVGLEQDGGVQALQTLYGRLEDALRARGFERERRPLSAHLTVARVREDAPRALARSVGETVARLAARELPSGSFEVDALTVMRSDLSPRGPRYTPLARVPLTGKWRV
jgi:2'-5' RNA ligase